MATKLQANECLVKIPGRDKPLRTLTAAVEGGTYGPDAEILQRGKPTASDKDAKTPAASAKKGT